MSRALYWDLKRTEAMINKITAENAAYLNEYVLDQDVKMSEEKNEKARKIWLEQRKDILATARAMSFMGQTIPPLLAVLELAAAMPITDDKEKNMMVIKITKANAQALCDGLCKTAFAETKEED